MAYPRFPQPKLEWSERTRILSLPAALGCAAVVFLRAGDPSATMKAERLRGSAAMRRLVGNSVATRLFDSGLLSSHLETCSALVQSTPCFELDYPHRPDAVAEVADWIRTQIFPRESEARSEGFGPLHRDP